MLGSFQPVDCKIKPLRDMHFQAVSMRLQAKKKEKTI